MSKLYEWLRLLDARMTSAIAPQEPLTDRAARVAAALAGAGLALLVLAVLLLTNLFALQLGLITVAMLMTVPYVQDVLDKTAAALRSEG